MSTTLLRHDDNRGGLAYPFLPADLHWQIVGRPFATPGASHDDRDPLTDILTAPTPTLRWVKDDRVLDLYVPGMDHDTFLARSGLRLTQTGSGYTLSKRLSRLMRPYRYWDFLAADDVTIGYDDTLDGHLWDGSGQVSRAFVGKLADRLGDRLSPRQRHELLSTGRFEVTTAHAGGQDKGHVVVVDDLDVDFRFPAGSAKPEVALIDGRTFIGLQPVHSRDQMRLDIQSLINLYPFFRPEHLLAWAGLEADLFLESIRSGRLEGIVDRLAVAESAADLDALDNWHVGDYIASGGRLMWFAGLVRAAGRQHLARLDGGGLRLPVPGGRYYIAPAAVGNQTVPPGQVLLDRQRATAWVSDADWLTTITHVLGGCDGDDAVWVVAFHDAAAAGEIRLLLWRSPNQVGEAVLLTPVAGSHLPRWQTAAGQRLSLPRLDSRRLPPRVDRVPRTYGQLAPATGPTPTQMDAAAPLTDLDATIRQAAANRGVLGAYCNTLMLCQAVYGRLPDRLPASLEAVIDASVKDGRDLTAVRDWNRMAANRIVAHGRTNPQRALPAALRDRLPAWLQAQAVVAGREGADRAQPHWLDVLVAGLETHKAQYRADLDALATAACPPLPLFDYGRSWLHAGRGLRQVYSRALRQALGDSDADQPHVAASDLSAAFEAARVASETYLSQWPADRHPDLLLGAAAALYAAGPQDGAPVGDGLLWQLGAARPGGGRAPGIAQAMVAALRHIGLLGEPVWTRVGPVRAFADVPSGPPPGVPVRFNGVWMNLLNAAQRQRGQQPYARMAEAPPEVRDQAKARIADLVHNRFRGMVLTTAVTDASRVVAYTPQGNLFGYVQRDHELAAVRHDRWRIAWAEAVDGNVCAILEPVA